jgi:DNA-binding GntR family transcriptional regulator
LADTVYAALRDAIIDGRLAPGDWLRQETLAQELGVSQMPVREGLRRLVTEGLAERIPYRGVRVIEHSPEDIADMITMRLVLESLAVRFAAPLMSDAEIGKLRENLQEAAALTEQDQMTRRRQLNTEFHLTICRASGRRYLIRQVEQVWGWFPGVILYEGIRRQAALSAARLATETDEHQAILDALARRDSRLAETLTRRHIETLSAELSDLVGIIDQPMDEPLEL